MPQRRITVEEVLEAYRVTGMKPVQGNFFRSDGCCCAIGAVAISRGTPRTSEGVCGWAETMLHAAYLDGFIGGFDGAVREESLGVEHDQGYADGTAVREAVFGKQGA